VATIIRRGQANVTVLDSDERWMGITYPQDKEDFRARILERIAAGEYPDRLWPLD